MSPEPDILVVRGLITDVVCAPLLAPREERHAAGLPRTAALAYVAGRSLLRRLLGRWLDRDPRPIELDERPDEKPRLAHCDSDLDFNVSHGGDLVLVALARGRNVGVDVEPISARRDVAAIAEAALGPDAAFELSTLAPKRRAARFTCWWVRIEALCKASGAGLTMPIDPAIPPGFAVRDVAVAARHRAAVAFDGSVPPRLDIIDWSTP